MTQDHVDQISRSLVAGGSRRGLLRALGVGGASGLLAVGGLEAIAGDRPHQRQQEGSKQRNRKQRNSNKNQNTNANDNNGGGGQLGSVQNCVAQCQEQIDGCLEPCAGNPSSLEFCETRCNEQQSECEELCSRA